MVLKNIATIQSGYHFVERIENDKNGDYHFIQLKDIDNYNKIMYSQLTKCNLQNVKDTQLLKIGDVIIKTRGLNFTASVIDEDLSNLIATSHFFVLRVNNTVLPEYLANFINDDKTQKVIKLGTAGTNVQIINKVFLESLEVATPTLDIQHKIVRIKELSFMEEKLVNKKMSLRKLFIDSKLRKLLI